MLAGQQVAGVLDRRGGHADGRETLDDVVVDAGLNEALPEGLDYDAGLGEETALYLQRVAWQTVQTYQER